MAYKMEGWSGNQNSPLKDRQSRLRKRAAKASSKTFEGGNLTDSDLMGLAGKKDVRAARKEYRKTKKAIRKGTYEYKTESSEGPHYSYSATETRKQAKAGAKKKLLLTKVRHESLKKNIKRQKENPRTDWRT